MFWFCKKDEIAGKFEFEESVLDVITEDKAKFILNQTEKVLNFTVESIDIIKNKSFTMIIFILVILFGSFGLILSGLSNTEVKTLILIPPTAILMTSLLISFVLLYLNILTKKVFPDGNEPKDLCKTKIISLDLKLITCTVIQDYQESINENRKTSTSLASKLNMAITIPFIGLIVALIYYFIILIF